LPQVANAIAFCYILIKSPLCTTFHLITQESRAVAGKAQDAAGVLFGLKFADNIHYKFKSSQASKARLRGSKRTGAKQNLTQNGYSRSFKVMYFDQERRQGSK